MTWLAYTAGEPIPDGAVVGGFLPTKVDTTAYVIRAQVAVDDQFGYYYPDSNFGYVEDDGAVIKYTAMDIMVIA